MKISDAELIVELTKENRKYEIALQRIAAWNLPQAEWRGQPCSYEVCYGSNGARDFIKKVASDALKP